jgi:hypothetical protein
MINLLPLLLLFNFFFFFCNIVFLTFNIFFFQQPKKKTIFNFIIVDIIKDIFIKKVEIKKSLYIFKFFLTWKRKSNFFLELLQKIL